MRYDVHPPLGHPEVAGWVLGTLDRHDSGAFGEHLRSCSRCQAAVAEFEPVAAALGRPVPAGEPPPGLEIRVLAAVQHAVPAADAAELPSSDQTWQAVEGWQVVPGVQTGELPRLEELPRLDHAVPREREGAAPRPRRVNNVLLVAAMAAAAAIAVGVVLLGRAVFRPTPPATASATVSLHAAAGAAGSGTATARQDAGGWSVQLTVSGLSKLSAGRFYECWFAGPGGRQLIAAGTFTVNGSGSQTFAMWTAADPRRFKTVEITAEGPASVGQHSTGQHGPVILQGTVPG